MSHPRRDSETGEDARAQALAALRAKRNKKAKMQARLRKERARVQRAAAVQSGEAHTVSVAKAAELLGVSPDTIRRRIADGTIKAKKLVGEGRKWGPVLVYLDQLG